MKPPRHMVIPLLLGCLAFGCGEPTTRSDRWNVVFILVDTLRADHLSCYGYEIATSPNLDRFAAKAALFENAYCQAPWTLSSVSSIFSSLYPQTHGLIHASAMRPLPGSVDTLAEVLRSAGHVTSGFVANTLLLEESGVHQGFDEYQVIPLDSPRRRHNDSADRINERAIPWLRENRRDPFFLYLHYMDPHDPYGDPAGYHRELDADYEGPFDGGIHEIFKAMGTKQPWSLDRRDLKNMVARYDGEIRYVDEHIQKILEELDRLELSEKTIVVITSDHGEQFMEHGSLKHGSSIHQEEVRIPLILEYPRMPRAGSRIVQAVESIDLYPTILDLLGIELDRKIDGRSLLPLLKGEAVDRDIFVETSHGWLWEDDRVVKNKVPMKAVIRDRWKLISCEDRIELYDLEADPGENSDLATEQSQVAHDLRRRVLEWSEGTKGRRIEWRKFNADELEAIRKRGEALGYLMPASSK